MATKYYRDFSISFKRADSDDKDILSNFECENQSIRNFARHSSIKSKKDVTYLFIDDEANAVIGFCSIRCSGISITEFEEDDENKPYTSTIPAVEISCFAIDERYRKIPIDENSKKYETVSHALFLYMLNYIKGISADTVGATHVCLYSVQRAKNFYKECDFLEFSEYMKRDEKPYIKNCIPMFYVI